ncbi:DotG/IcmE/VirB10 family protein [Litoreibacter roseus]|uniref:Intracellular multiplication protein IcmE n=1 Tax=Litoreibacter roseus TaxID=2601869 RepID=A0A6N6JNM4_9RHOB|nr:DotG/IcmE/VirB10 family protein [Litoreibacter roseus]GFE66972.1 hypothetical protein KIN_40460 [Litoreibacter roseus]
MSKTDEPKAESEDQEAPKAQSTRRIERPRSRGLLSFRNVALLSVLAVGGAVGFELWRNPDLIGDSRISGPPNVNTTPAGDQLRTSERYEDNLRRQNEQGAEEAADDGGSFIATPDEPLRQIDEPVVTAPANTNRPLPPANPRTQPAQEPQTIVIERPTEPVRQQPTAPAPEAAPNYDHINQLAQLMASQKQGLLQSWQVQPSGVTVVVEQDLLPQPTSTSTTDDLATQIGQDARARESAGEIVARAGDVVLASTIITNDSDTPGPVVAEIRRGPLTGTRLVGGFQPNQNNTYLVVQFGTAVLPDGTEIPVSAYAVDARQKSLAVRSDMDRRLIQRYAPRVAAAFVSGLGDALSDTGSTVVDLGGGVGISRPQATFEQGVYQGLAEVGNDLAGEFVRSAPQGPLISLRSRQIIGVLFTSNVTRP